MRHPRFLSRRSLFGALALTGFSMPGVALLTGCAGRRAVSATPEPAFPQRLGATVQNADGTRRFRNHPLLDQDGRDVRFYDDLIEGQVFAAMFMYVNCKGICSDMIGQMIDAYTVLQPVMGNPVRFYTFSLAQDPPAAMKEYMQGRGIYGKPGWTFLTGSPEVIKDIRWGFGFFDPNEELDANLEAHTGMARFGNHRLDRWSSCPALGNSQSTARSVVALFPPNKRPELPLLIPDEAPPARAIPGYVPRQPLG